MGIVKKRFYLKKYLRRMSWIQLAVILGFVLVAALVWVFILVYSLAGTFQLFLAFMTVIVTLGLSPILLQNVSHLVSRLEVSDQGLDYLFWPYYHIRCSWAEVQSIARRREVVVEADVLLLKNATEVGLPIAMGMRKRLGLDTHYFIPLNVWDGWPSGDLAEALRHYATGLFEKQPSSTSS